MGGEWHDHLEGWKDGGSMKDRQVGSEQWFSHILVSGSLNTPKIIEDLKELLFKGRLICPYLLY